MNKGFIKISVLAFAVLVAVVSIFAFSRLSGAVEATVVQGHSEVDYKKLACGETKFIAKTYEQSPNNQYLVVSAGGNTSNVNLPTNGNEVDLTVGPFTSNTTIYYRVFGGGERDYDAPLWNGYGGGTFGADINAYGTANGWDWVLSGYGDPNPFTTWNSLEVKGCFEEYKKVDAYEQCDGTLNVTVTTNSHREWRIGDEVVELGVQGGGVEDTHTWNNVPSDWLLEWSNVGKDDWKEADLDSESYTYNEYEPRECEVPTTPEQPRVTSTPSAPVCPNGVPAVVPANPHVVRNGSEAQVNAHIPEGNVAHIYFRENSSSDWQHAERDIPVVGNYLSHTIKNLNPNLGYTFGIQAANGCAGGETVVAVVIDPPALGEVFMLSYYEWLN